MVCGAMRTAPFVEFCFVLKNADDVSGGGTGRKWIFCLARADSYCVSFPLAIR